MKKKAIMLAFVSILLFSLFLMNYANPSKGSYSNAAEITQNPSNLYYVQGQQTYIGDRPDTAEIDKSNNGNPDALPGQPGYSHVPNAAWFQVRNDDNATKNITDFHVFMNGATIKSISTPSGWTGTKVGNNEAKWEANSTANGTPPGGRQGGFDINFTDWDSSHSVVAWVTYENDNRAYSIRYFDQRRETVPDKPGSWRTDSKSKAVIHEYLIGSDGGSLDIDGQGSIAVPAGAVTADTWFHAYGLPTHFLDYVKGTATDGRQIYKAFEFAPYGESFAQPLTIRLKYASLPGLINPQAYLYDPEQDTWSPVMSHIDADNQEVVFQTSHFTIYGIGGSPPPMPVGGIVELPGIEEPGVVTPDSSGHNYGALAGIIVGATVGTIMLISAAWYIRRRRTKAI